MTFINAALALGALAFTIPLAIHLLFRSRFRTVDWGAMHLLSGVLQTNRRRLRWTQLLLLLLRCLIPVLLAFALARPILTGWRTLPGETPQSVVLVIDNSRSMSATDAEGRIRLDRAKGAASRLLRGLSRRDEVMVIATGRRVDPPSIVDRDRGEEIVRSLRPQSGPFTLAEALSAAGRATEQAAHPHHRIVVLSDFQRSTLPAAVEAELDRLREVFAAREIPPTISLLSLGGDSAGLANVSVQSIRSDSPAAIRGQPTVLVAQLRNSSDLPAAGVTVRWSVDGRVVASKPMTIPPRADFSVRFRTRLETTGLHEISVVVEVDDVLPLDNRRRLAIDVIDAVDVLVIDPMLSRETLGNASDFFVLALEPSLEAEATQSDAPEVSARFNIVRGTPAEVAGSSLAIRQSVVVLCDVPLQPKLRRKLADFVLAGGSLVVFDGDPLRPSDYNGVWQATEGEFRLPMELGARPKDTDDGPPMQALGSVSPTYAPWSFLSDEPSPLRDVLVKRHREFVSGVTASPGDQAFGGREASTVLTLAD